MRPSSSTSSGEGGSLFGPLVTSDAVALAVSDPAWVQAMLDAEAALARAQARAGLIGEHDAEAIAACCRAERIDVPAVGRAATAAGNPVVPLVRTLTSLVGEPHGAYVHHGATSQDILDTAMMLVVSRALRPVLDDLAAASDACAELADRHRSTLLAGRTLLQQALPVTFGLKAAGWLVALDDARLRLAEVRRERLAAQLGGAAGTLASLGAEGPRVVELFAAELGLAVPVVPWHTGRGRVAELAGGLGAVSGVAAKIAHDVVLLAQTEVGEATEGGGPDRGGSSTLPHKRNPVGAITTLASARRAPALVATLLAAMEQEHERAAGWWQAEWEPLRDLFRVTGGAAHGIREVVSGLEVHADAMRANLDRTGGLLLAEHVTTALTPKLGRLAAHERVQAACRTALSGERSLRSVLLDDPEVAAHLRPADVDTLLDPAGYLGASDTFVERALAHHRAVAPSAPPPPPRRS
ncbi:MAG: 3-carboxy-cis,cis-muconate cycloisomerase [Streptosporangiaceae bacterium]